MGGRCTCGGDDLCRACQLDPLDAAEPAPFQQLVMGMGAKYPPAPAPERSCEACGSAPGGPVAREPFDWTFRWLCPPCAALAQGKT